MTQNIASFLGIDASRIRIVSIRKGSVIIDQIILPEETEASEDDITDPNDPNYVDPMIAVKKELDDMKKKIDEGMSGEALDLSSIGTVSEYVADVKTVPAPEPDNIVDED